MMDTPVEVLFSQSKNFCVLPWIHTHSVDKNKNSLCVHNTNTVGKINSKKYCTIRLNMLEDRAVKGCENCAMRKTYLEQYKQFVDIVEDTMSDGSVVPFEMHHLVVNEHTNFETVSKISHNVLQVQFEDPQCLENKDHVKWLKFLLDNSPHVELNYTTALSNSEHWPDEVVELWSRFETIKFWIDIYCIDSNVFVRDVQLIKKNLPQLQLGLKSQVSLANAHHCADLLEYFYKENLLDLTLPLKLENCEAGNVKYLPKQFADPLIAKYRNLVHKFSVLMQSNLLQPDTDQIVEILNNLLECSNGSRQHIIDYSNSRSLPWKEFNEVIEWAHGAE
jgi:hypothetical protein